ncbi:MAG: hypothetical protein ABSC93_16220 [Bryobacteraceae bacterium]|jgi:hypothetical protein
MPLAVFMVGHGAWYPKDGFFQLPPNCSFSMVVDIGKVLKSRDQIKVCAGKFERDYSRTIGGEGGSTRTCPNMSWLGDNETQLTVCRAGVEYNTKDQPAIMLHPKESDGSVKLSTFFKHAWARMAMDYHARFGEVHFVWNCCSYVGLNPSHMGARLGVNAAHTGELYDHVSYVRGVSRYINTFTHF